VNQEDAFWVFTALIFAPLFIKKKGKEKEIDVGEVDNIHYSIHNIQ